MKYGGNKCCCVLLASLLICVLNDVRASAEESIFAWTYTTDLLSKSEWGLEHWTTARLQKEHGTYQGLDFREEIEYGISDNFQAALYVNHHWANSKNSFPEEDPGKLGHRLAGSYVTGGEDVHPGHDSLLPFKTYHFESISTEFIYRLLNPDKDKIGLALYMEPTIGADETELEWKLILHKTWFDDQLEWAFNANYDLEFKDEGEGEFERDAAFEWFTGLSYRIIPSWSGGFELWNHHEFADATEHENSAWFIGPTVHYGGKGWSATLGFLRQLPWGQAFNEDQKEFAYHNGYIFGEEHEKYYIRIKVGIDF